MNIVLFGAPGAGKGTQSSLLVKHEGMAHISTGDLFRAAIKNGTDLGKKAQLYMNKGELVPDAIVIGMVEEVFAGLDGRGFILDGFPRTEAQAEALESMLSRHGKSVEKALFLEVPRGELLARLSGRRVCKDCGAVFHAVSKRPKKDGTCDACGGALYQRADDKEEVIGARLDEYRKNTLPLVDYYKGKGKYVEIDGLGSTEGIFAALRAELH